MQFAPGAWRYALPAFLLAAPLAVVSPLLSAAAVVAGGTVLGFHRDPDRRAPAGGVVSPADGRVSVVREEGGRLRVGVYMGPADVHVNRAPLSGRVEAVERSPGAHWPAFSKESDRNEQVRIDCDEFAVVLIAGAFARRIHPYVRPGDDLERGERIGHISFGSRADVLFPEGITRDELSVRKGQRVYAGETLLAKAD